MPLMMSDYYFLSMTGKLMVKAAIIFMAGADLPHIRRLPMF